MPRKCQKAIRKSSKIQTFFEDIQMLPNALEYAWTYPSSSEFSNCKWYSYGDGVVTRPRPRPRTQPQPRRRPRWRNGRRRGGGCGRGLRLGGCGKNFSAFWTFLDVFERFERFWPFSNVFERFWTFSNVFERFGTTRTRQNICGFMKTYETSNFCEHVAKMNSAKLKVARFLPN